MNSQGFLFDIMKLIVAGSRNFNDFKFITKKLDQLLSETREEVEIVCGQCRGVDELGEAYAIHNHYKVTFFPADWENEGKAAGFRRNKRMAEYATHCVCFWDGKSAGTKLMIDLAKEYNLILRIINLNPHG